jgi:uncharacterized protein
VKIDISSIEQEPVSFDERLTVEAERLGSEVLTSPVEVRLDGEARPHGGSLTVFGRFRATSELICSRCLEAVPWSVDESYSVEYRRTPATANEDEVGLEEDDLDVVFLDEEALDLVDLAAEQILLAMPMRILCDENCAGLCPTCGANRNGDGACECPPEVDPRWRALEGLSGSSPES